jgi:accessory colonization factor AcfC
VVIYDNRMIRRLAVNYMRKRRDMRQAKDMLDAVFGTDTDMKLAFVKNYREVLRNNGTSNSIS